MKRCCTCKEMKSKEEFTKNKSTKDGLAYQCKECIALYRNSEKAKKLRKKYMKKYTKKESYKTKARKNANDFNKKKKENNFFRWKYDNLLNSRKYLNNYIVKGVTEVKLTFEEYKILWAIYNADYMKFPEIHRLDSEKIYSFTNCVFLEKEDHRRYHLRKTAKKKHIRNKQWKELCQRKKKEKELAERQKNP